MKADLVITNGKVITVDKDFSIRQAVAVKDGKIVAVGSDEDVKALVASDTRVLDLRGKPLLPGISIPTLVVQSDGDPVANPKGSKQIFKKVGTEDKEYILFNIDRHGILLGEGSERVHKRIGTFVERLGKP